MQRHEYLNPNLAISYTVTLKQRNCGICGRPCDVRAPLDIVETSARKPACKECAAKYASELYIMVNNYYSQVSPAERHLLGLL